jgi:hypothetical protein
VRLLLGVEKYLSINEKFGVNMKNRSIGIILLVVGVALAAWGYNIYDSASSQLTRAISGDTPIEAWGGMVGGAICSIIGILKIR